MNCAGKVLDLSRPCVMGILNVTPDSFSDGGRFDSLQNALDQAQLMIEQGARIIDIGGESTRPGAQAVGVSEELDRVVPVIEALSKEISVPISIDTNKPEVMCEAVNAGAGMINDVMALTADGALEAALEAQVPVCIMHMQGKPRTMQENPQYGDVVEDIYAYLAGRIDACVNAGINREEIIVDPGFGFGKTLDQNLSLLANFDRFSDLGVPVLAGISRKSMLGAITGKDVEDRVAASVAAALISLQRGASIVRVHDVAETVDAIAVLQAVDSI